MTTRLPSLLSFPLYGNGLFKPLDSGLRRNDGKVGFLGGLFQTPLYHGSAELAERPTSL